MKHRLTLPSALLIALLAALPAHAAPLRRISITGPDIRLSDVLPRRPELAGVSLGPAPAPGSSRVVTRRELTVALKDQGAPVGRLPRGVRVVRKMQTLGRQALSRLVTSAYRKAGKPGVKLLRVRAPGRVRVAAGWNESVLQVPKHPKRKGRWTGSATLVLRASGVEVARLAVPLELDVSAQAARADVPRGTPLTLLVKRGRIQIQVRAYAVGDLDIGAVAPLQLRPSGRMVRAKIVASDRAVAEASR